MAVYSKYTAAVRALKADIGCPLRVWAGGGDRPRRNSKPAAASGFRISQPARVAEPRTVNMDADELDEHLVLKVIEELPTAAEAVQLCQEEGIHIPPGCVSLVQLQALLRGVFTGVPPGEPAPSTAEPIEAQVPSNMDGELESAGKAVPYSCSLLRNLRTILKKAVMLYSCCLY